MSIATRLVAAAIAIAIVAVGGALILRPGVPSVGSTRSATPSAAPKPSASSPSSAALPGVAVPADMLGDWQAKSATLDGMFAAGEPMQLSINWDGGREFWIQTTTGSRVLKSDSVVAPAGEIALVTATGAEAAGCQPGQLGRYTWSRSTDGLFLTMTAVTEACANRQAALARTWVHSQSAVTDGRTGVFPFDGWIKMTLPRQRFGLSGTQGLGYLHPMEGPDRKLLIIKDPLGIDQPCGTTRAAIDIPQTTAGFVSYVRTLPGFTTSTEAATVGGRPAVHVTIRPRGSATCQNGEIVAFHGALPDEPDSEWSLAVGAPHSMWVIEFGGHTVLVIYEGADVTPADESSVISSFQFLPELPTP